ncbi:hypothetical protein ES703_113054 [subsurface metagenome]
MVKGVKKADTIIDDHVSVKVKMHKSTYKALKLKTTLLDISVKQGILDLIEKWVRDVKRDLVNSKPNR